MGRKILIKGNVLCLRALDYKNVYTFATDISNILFDDIKDIDLTVDDKYCDDNITDTYFITGDMISHTASPESGLRLIYNDFNFEMYIINVLINSSIATSEFERETLNRLLYLNVVSSFETLVANIFYILYKIIQRYCLDI